MMPIVDVIAPASACSDERLAAGIATLERWGLQPRVPSDLFTRGKRGMLANTDAARLAHLVAALRARDSRLLWCVRGGYGSLRLLERLAKTRLTAVVTSKVMVGFSDISALQLMGLEAFGVQAMHGAGSRPVGLLTQRPQGAARARSGHLRPHQGDGRRPGRWAAACVQLPEVEADECAGARGSLRSGPAARHQPQDGSNSHGTGWLPPGRGVIWCFEDVGERGYEVDRALSQLALSGAFTGTRAVIFGAFAGGEEPGGKRSVVPEALRRFAENAKFPVLQGLPIGHSRRNWPLPIGNVARLSLGAEAGLSVAV